MYASGEEIDSRKDRSMNFDLHQASGKADKDKGIPKKKKKKKALVVA